jgi:hypothetical protein
MLKRSSTLSLIVMLTISTASAFVVPPSGGSVRLPSLPPEGGTTNAFAVEIVNITINESIENLVGITSPTSQLSVRLLPFRE